MARKKEDRTLLLSLSEKRARQYLEEKKLIRLSYHSTWLRHTKVSMRLTISSRRPNSGNTFPAVSVARATTSDVAAWCFCWKMGFQTGAWLWYRKWKAKSKDGTANDKTQKRVGLQIDVTKQNWHDLVFDELTNERAWRTHSHRRA